MMNSALIKKLRNENKFEEAYKLSKSDLDQNGQDIWAKRNHSWSLYYMIKKHVQAGETAQAKHYLGEFEALNMPKDETLIYERMGYFIGVLQADYLQAKKWIAEGKFLEAFDLHVSAGLPTEQLAWSMYYLLKSHNKSGHPSLNEVRARCRYFRGSVQPEKKLIYKLLLQELIKTKPEFWEGWDQQCDFLEWMGLFGVLDEEDFEKQEWDGKKIIALAERLHIAYSKALLREGADKEKVTAYIAQVVEPLLEPCKGMLYVPFFKAKLLLGTGNREDGLSAFLPFARKKQKEFWVWQVFAEAYESDKEMYLSCLCKAMLCPSRPEFLSGIKERLITHLVAKQSYDWAKTELSELVSLRQKMGWGIRSHHQQLLDLEWYREASEVGLPEQYQKHSVAAVALLGERQGKEVTVLVYQVNADKNMFSFIGVDRQQGYGHYMEKPTLYGLYQLEGIPREGGYFKVMSMKKAIDTTGIENIKKEINGPFRQKAGQAFGFVAGVFVSPDLIKQYGLTDGEEVKGLAISSQIKGKNSWGWKLVAMENRKG
jgi:hypothetical protein